MHPIKPAKTPQSPKIKSVSRVIGEGRFLQDLHEWFRIGLVDEVHDAVKDQKKPPCKDESAAISF